tara:strand:- start:5103 stop:5279 length:177 start_codon:yes stop_codon:yes gene_type:complete
MNRPLMFINNMDLIEGLKTRIWQEYLTIKNCDFQGWLEGLSPIEKVAWEVKFDEVQDS